MRRRSRAIVAGDYIFFSATNSQGIEPWRTNGTTASTFQIGNINTRLPVPAAAPRTSGAFDGVVYFGAVDGTATETWRTTGSTAVQDLDRDQRPGRPEQDQRPDPAQRLHGGNR